MRRGSEKASLARLPAIDAGVRKVRVEVAANVANDFTMNQSLEERVKLLEEKLAALETAQSLGLKPVKKDWRSTVGTIPDDEHAREAERLGREDREAQTYEKEIARS